MSEAHARLGPSNHRWPNCPGSVREEAVYPDVAGTAAIDGTGSHLLLELCLQNNCRAEAYDMQVIGANHHDSPNGWLVDKARVERVQMCLDYVERRVKELRDQFPGCKVSVEAETKADPGGYFGRDDWWGTVDITITVVNKHGRCQFIEVIDYKDGRGYVSEKDNSQLVSYIGGKMRPWVGSGPDLVRPFKPEQVGGCRMTIVQPKTNPVVRYQEKPATEIMNQLVELDRAAGATDDPNAPLIPDDKGGKGYCRWCKHKPNCTATAGAGIEAVKIMTNVTPTGDKPLFELLENAVANVTEMEAEKLADLADTEASVSAIYDKIKKEIERRLGQGLEVPGYEMQNGKKSRVWNADEETIAKKLKSRKLKKDQIYPSQLISVAQVMKLDCLDDAQKARLEKELVTEKYGAKKLTKVARKPKEQQSVEMLFASVPKSSAPSLFDDSNNVGQSSNTVSESSPISFM